MAWGAISVQQWRHDRPLFWIDLAVGLVSFPLVFYRRRWPFPIAMLLTLFGAVSGSSAGPDVLAVVSLSTRRRLTEIIPVGVVGVAASYVYSLYQPDPDESPHWVNLTVSLAVTVAVIAWGMFIGSRRELIWTLRERALHAEAERDLRVGQAQSAERERIAREMHDVLAHRISLVTMHAGALAYRTDLPPEQVRETAQLIQAKAHEALTDLRQVLGVLRGDETVGVRPQPTLADLDELLAEAREGGMVVDLADGLDGRTPSEQVGRTLYRIVQEALTNARKHAPGTHVSVRLHGDPEAGVTVTVRNAKPVGVRRPAAPGAGLGLVGLRERAALAGGTLSVDDTPAAFVLRGWLPWQTS
ncbi:MAG: histidine kinase [Nocardioidaceae bacterium]|nr:histidine kinase [Nocardioidaceae bacterium]